MREPFLLRLVLWFCLLGGDEWAARGSMMHASMMAVVRLIGVAAQWLDYRTRWKLNGVCKVGPMRITTRLVC